MFCPDGGEKKQWDGGQGVGQSAYSAIVVGQAGYIIFQIGQLVRTQLTESNTPFPVFNQIMDRVLDNIIGHGVKGHVFQVDIIAEHNCPLNFILLPVNRICVTKGETTHAYIHDGTSLEVKGNRTILTCETLVLTAFC